MSTGDPAALAARARACAEGGDHAGALAALDALARSTPLDPVVQTNRCLSLAALGQLEAAVAAGARATELGPTLGAAHGALGSALRHLARLPEALACLDRALALDAALADAHVNRGLVLQEMGRVAEALAAHRRALAVRPDLVEAWTNIGICLQGIGDADGAAAAFERTLELRPGDVDACSNWLMGLQYDPALSARRLRDAARRWNVVHRQRHGAVVRTRPSPRRVDGPLRVGYVSADLRAHPVGWFLADVLPAHDPSAVEVHCYASQRTRDTMTESLMRCAHGWSFVADLSDAALTERIRADGIDVLVDLSGHTAGNRLGVFARGAAPVQVSWLGYFATTGVDGMDAALLGADQAPPGAEAFFTETLVRLDRNQFVYRPPDYAPDPRPAPARRAITFGSFNNLAKVSPEVLVAWARVLDAVPASWLVLKWRGLDDAWVAERVRRQLAGAGIDPRRVELRGASSHERMLADYDGIDVALDPFPFSGALTTCEALWMGVPVVTLPWQRPVSRQTMAILRDLGLDDLVARNVDDYAAIAAQLADDAPRRHALRLELRARIEASPLRDGASLARSLESRYRMLHAARLSA
ncbi:MAG: tetratricopeptide repeat protein [Ectothiorhodospiraceae bacterium]|nr:tetratricopeptide repeat protein [Ectothiorhodospiraceae bacterium]